MNIFTFEPRPQIGMRPDVVSAGIIDFHIRYLAVNSMPLTRKYMHCFLACYVDHTETCYTSQLSTFLDVRFISSYDDDMVLCEVSL
jgi:hypothetical protein